MRSFKARAINKLRKFIVNGIERQRQINIDVFRNTVVPPPRMRRIGILGFNHTRYVTTQKKNGKVDNIQIQKRFSRLVLKNRKQPAIAMFFQIEKRTAIAKDHVRDWRIITFFISKTVLFVLSGREMFLSKVFLILKIFNTFHRT